MLDIYLRMKKNETIKVKITLKKIFYWKLFLKILALKIALETLLMKCDNSIYNIKNINLSFILSIAYLFFSSIGEHID